MSGALANDELACVYSALILADDDIPVTSEKISTILKAAEVDVEPIWPTLYAKALQGVNIKDLISKIGAGAAPTAGTAAAAAAPEAEVTSEKKEEKKVEESDSEDDDMGFGLFD